MDWMIIQITNNGMNQSDWMKILIRSSSVLTNPLFPNCSIGSEVYTADLSYMAIKNLDGSWTEV